MAANAQPHEASEPLLEMEPAPVAFVDLHPLQRTMEPMRVVARWRTLDVRLVPQAKGYVLSEADPERRCGAHGLTNITNRAGRWPPTSRPGTYR